MKKLLLSFLGAFVIFTLSAQIVENFSDYTVGGKLAQQAQSLGRDYWTTWSEAPGGNEDGVIAEIGGKKCVKLIAPNNDQVLWLGKKSGTTWVSKTTGVWEVDLKFYIPSGKDGYFNIKNTFPSTVSETWAVQVYLATDEGSLSTPGIGKIYAGSSDGVTFPFSHDTWVTAKIIIDLDKDLAKFYVSDLLIHSWKYSLGSFGQSNHKFISALNIFPPNTAATSEFYVTDISFGLNFDFDELAVGAKVGASYPDFWTGFLGQVSEDGTVSNEQASSAPNSVKLVWDNDLVFVPGLLTSGVYTLDFDMYLPNNAPAYFNLLHVFDGYDSEWAVGVYFNTTASGMPVGTNIQQDGVLTPFTAPNNRWFPISLYIDIDNDVARISIDGEHLLQWNFSVIENPAYGGTPRKQLTAVDFYPPQAGSVFFIDNFRFCVPPPKIEQGDEIFATGFDDVPNNSYVAQSYPEFWTTWDNKPGTDEDALITNAQSASPPQSAKCDWGTDLIFKAGDKTSGIFSVSFDMYIPDEAPAFFNILHAFSGASSEWAAGFYFNIATGTPGMTAGTYVQQNNQRTPFTAPSNKWFPVVMYIDLDSDYASISINNIAILGWKFSNKESGGAGLKQLGAVDFYPPTANAVFYIDNFVYKITAAKESPIMNITPTSITETIIDGENPTKTVPITVKNTGNAAGTYQAQAVCPAGWLTLGGDISGTVATDGSKSFDALVDATKVEVGDYEAVILITTNDGNPVTEITCILSKLLDIEIITLSQAQVFPNPASDRITVKCNKEFNTIQIINISGQIVYSATVNGDQTTIDTSNLSAGNYFIRVITNEGAHSVKLIIK